MPIFPCGEEDEMPEIFFVVDRASPRGINGKGFGMKMRILLGTLYRFPNDWNDPDRKNAG